MISDFARKHDDTNHLGCHCGREFEGFDGFRAQIEVDMKSQYKKALDQLGELGMSCVRATEISKAAKQAMDNFEEVMLPDLQQVLVCMMTCNTQCYWQSHVKLERQCIQAHTVANEAKAAVEVMEEV